MQVKRKRLAALLVAGTLTMLTGCGGGSSAPLNAADIKATVICGPNRNTSAGVFSESDCTISIWNQSASSGTIGVFWDWIKFDGKQCGSGWSKTPTSGDDVGYYIIEGNQRASVEIVSKSLCSPGQSPTAENIRVKVVE
jgi:hypothetical protein